jgi:mannonate dehydratase
MDRRGFIQGGAAIAGAAMAGTGVTVAEAAASVVRGEPPRAIQRPLKMRVGTQRNASTPAVAQEFVRHGVRNWVSSPRTSGGRTYWIPSDIEATLDFAEANGLTVEMVTLPLLGSTNIDTERRPAIMLGQSPERDRDIEDIHRCIEACAIAGVKAFKYNMSILGVPSTGEVTLRGGSTSRQFRAADIAPNLPLTRAGIVTAEMFWERIDYFVQRVIPVCEQYKIQAACHPQDPGTPPGGYRGVLENVLSTPGGMGLFKFLSLHNSQYHGLNLCCGTLGEMLWDINEIYDILRALARTKRVFNIHMRNIIGHRDDFIEAWPDEGDINHARLVQILAEEGFEYSIDPDHIPDHVDDPGNKQGYAHGYGYIKALIQAVDTLSPPYGRP